MESNSSQPQGPNSQRNRIEILSKLRKISTNIVWKSKWHECDKKCTMLEQLIEEVKTKSKKDIEVWTLQAEHSRKLVRKLEDDVYQYKKTIGELEGADAKYKKELIEKEKLLKTLDEINKEKKYLEEILETNKNTVLRLTEVNEEISKKESELNCNDLKEKLEKAESEINELAQLVEKGTMMFEELKLSNSSLLNKTKVLEDNNSQFQKTISSLNQDLENKNKEIQALQNSFSNYKALVLESKEREMILFKISINPEAEPQTSQFYINLQQQAQDLQAKVSEVLNEKTHLENRCKELDKMIQACQSENESKSAESQAKISALEEQTSIRKAQTDKLIKYCTDLEQELKESSKTIQDLENKLNKLTYDLESKADKLNNIEQDSESYNSIISQINKEKIALEALVKQKDTKLKSLLGKVSTLENQIIDKSKEILAKENELMNADRQIDLLKKRVNTNSSKIKQIASDQIEVQKKKLESNESEIKMLKEMLKSFQSELKQKQLEIQKYKKSPKKKEPVYEESPLQMKARHVPEPEAKPQQEYVNNISPSKKLQIEKPSFKKNFFYMLPQSVSIFKAHSPFKPSSKKNLKDIEVSVSLEHIVKGYLTSYVLCEKERKELIKAFQEEDSFNRGVLSKDHILKKCEEVVLDTSLLNMYKNEVDYKDFVEMHYHNQLQQIHHDLDMNFSQLPSGTISMSELKLIRQGLRPLHKQIWDVIVERIGGDFTKEVEINYIKHILSQTTISL